MVALSQPWLFQTSTLDTTYTCVVIPTKWGKCAINLSNHKIENSVWARPYSLLQNTQRALNNVTFTYLSILSTLQALSLEHGGTRRYIKRFQINGIHCCHRSRSRSRSTITMPLRVYKAQHQATNQSTALLCDRIIPHHAEDLLMSGPGGRGFCWLWQ